MARKARKAGEPGEKPTSRTSPKFTGDEYDAISRLIFGERAIRELGGRNAAFSGHDNITRGEAALLLSRAIGESWQGGREACPGNFAVDSFDDISGSQGEGKAKVPYRIARALADAIASGIIDRDPDNPHLARPTDPLNGADACGILVRAFGTGPLDPSARTFDPKRNVSRNEFCAALIECMGLSPKDLKDLKDLKVKALEASVDLAATSATSAISASGVSSSSQNPSQNPSQYPLGFGDGFTFNEYLIGSTPIADRRFEELQEHRLFTPVHAFDAFTYQESRVKNILVRVYPPKRRSYRDPLLIYVYGGGFMAGDTGTMQVQSANLLEACIDNGVAVACLTYSYATQAPWIQSINELKGQIRWLRANAGMLGLDENSFGISGASAGGYWASMLGLTVGDLSLEGELFGNGNVSGKLNYVLSMYGLYDVARLHVQTDPLIQGPSVSSSMHDSAQSPEAILFGLSRYKSRAYPKGFGMKALRDVIDSADVSHELWPFARAVLNGSPISHAKKDSPPTLLYHGVDDPLVPVEQSVEMYAAMKCAGANPKILLAAHTGHEAAHAAKEAEMYNWVLAMARAGK